ncbi:TPA: hypothetical protein ME741_002760 [Klebsiella pneumoniae]|uniref:hypothetical protein n=1 Tax=Klebsiella pneumoniae TaxID=573 RepID=UPI0007CC6136|nr:hypothetical protein [Klebsiella pneumoniae]QLN83754.1 hypothetical protein HV113_09685 [Klebsiella pneumoniae]SAX24131.1 Uncharacterised protein [Klebsiella pneumoniae]HBW4732773.1 hypothetical protein [Klebsiella pneumoniae]HBW5594178.1 hypothetical protein [Klebsiella pneumoniae]HBW6883509.1 hypothetical protein [Klebsiella pneumoniae]
MNFFKAEQEAYTTSKVALPHWPSGVFIVWGQLNVETPTEDENGIITTITEKYTGLIKVTEGVGTVFIPSDSEKASDKWLRLE